MNRNSTAATTAALVKLLEAARREIISMHEDLLRPPDTVKEIGPVAIARAIAQARLLSRAIFDDRILAGPAWYMMLHLYVAANEGRAVVSSAVGEAVGVPFATAHRWLRVFEVHGHITRRRHDGRTSHVYLTPDAHAHLTDVLRMAATALGNVDPAEKMHRRVLSSEGVMSHETEGGDTYSESETDARREALLKAMLITPREPRKGKGRVGRPPKAYKDLTTPHKPS